MAASISLEELRAEFDRLGVAKDDAGLLTTQEMSDKWGVSRATVREWLHQAKALGVLRTGTKYIETLNLKQLPTTGYRFEFPKVKKKK